MGWLGRKFSLTAWYKYLSGYGEKWGQALVSLFLAWLIFSSLNVLWIEPNKWNLHPDSFSEVVPCSKTLERCPGVKWVDSAFFTLNTMTLRKDPYFRIKNIWQGKLAMAIESFAGVTIIALILLAIRRQFRR